MDDIRVAVVGYGLAGSAFHVPLVQAQRGMRVASVVTSSPERQGQVRADCPGTRVFADVEELWKRAADHDLVVLATPTGTHVPLAHAAIDRDLPVVVDKPFAVDAASGEALVDAAEERGVPLTCFLNRRWDSDQLTLRRLLDQGALGRVVRYESRFERWRPSIRNDRWRDTLPPEQGGGVLLDLGSHLVDQALRLFGPAELAYADVRPVRGGPADDEAFLVLRHDGGIGSHLSMGAIFGSPGPRLRVVGTDGTFCVPGIDRQEEQLRAGVRPGDTEYGCERGWGWLARGEHAEPVTPEPGAWPEFYAGVVRALTERVPMPVDPRAALQAQRILDAARAQRSSTGSRARR